MIPFLRSPYNYDREAASNESAIVAFDESKAKQSFAEECDINTIVRRFGITGQFPAGLRAPTYGDFEGVVDFHSAMNAIALAGETFDRLPAEVRARFNNDPGAFVDFCSDEKNKEEAIKLGLVLPKAVELASSAPIAPKAPAAPEGVVEPDGA